MEYTVYHLYDSVFMGLYVYVYKAADRTTYPLLSQMIKFTPGYTLLHSHYSNPFNISAVVMLGILLCHFNTSFLPSGLCLSSLTKFFIGLFEFYICSLG